VQVHLINTSNLPVEAIESEYPLLIESYSLVEDSGGAGTFRGGLGLRRVIRPVGHVMGFTGQGERFLNRPWGIFGGEAAATGRFLLREAAADRVLPTKPGLTPVGPEAAIVVETAGGGGYGPAAGRSAAGLADDRGSGKFSDAFVGRFYPEA
jgi:N-methylhydantoinase B